MKNQNDRYTSLAIIGNGFDLAHDYKTSYNDFAYAVGVDFFAEYKDYLNKYGGDYSGSGEWYGFEDYVKVLSAKFHVKVISESLSEDIPKQFNAIFLRIKEKLIEYLQTETTTKPFREIESVRKYFGANTIGLNFNYTDIAQKYMHDIIYVHGSMTENEVVLGYDPVDPYCFTSFENIKWYKEFCRERLAFTRYISEKLKMPSTDTLYKELCEEYEQIQRLENSGKGFEMEDISVFKHSDFLREYMLTHRIDDVFAKKNISFENISKVIVLGHSIKADETYLKKILDKCPLIQQVIIFTYKGEGPEEWEAKADFFRPYCVCVEQEMY